LRIKKKGLLNAQCCPAASSAGVRVAYETPSKVKVISLAFQVTP
jgi:hypothetical protein